MNIQENILYEDSDILVCRKEAGTAVQTARIAQMDMESQLKNYLMEKIRSGKDSGTGKKNGKNGIDKAGGNRMDQPPYLAVIHRLDQPVSGVLVFAKTPFAAKELSRQVTDHTIGKYYLAEVDGVIPKEQDTLTDYLLKDARTNTTREEQKGTPGAKESVLHYKKRDDTHLEIELVTGRHHQIRVQLSHAGMPIVGDGKYNPEGKKSSQLQLCAYHLKLRHPRTKKVMEFFFE